MFKTSILSSYGVKERKKGKKEQSGKLLKLREERQVRLFFRLLNVSNSFQSKHFPDVSKTSVGIAAFNSI